MFPFCLTSITQAPARRPSASTYGEPAGITELNLPTLTTFYYQEARKRGLDLWSEVLTDSKLYYFYQLGK